MTRKMNINVHVVSHVKEKIVHVDTQTQAEREKLANIDEDIAKVLATCTPSVLQLINLYLLCLRPVAVITHWCLSAFVN